MSSAVSHSTTSMGLTALAIVVALATEGPLVDFALLGTAERHTVVFKLKSSKEA